MLVIDVLFVNNICSVMKSPPTFEDEDEEDERRRKRDQPRLKLEMNKGFLRKRLYTFCNETTLHGWRYIVQGPVYTWTSLLWILILVCLISTCVTFIVINTKVYFSATTRTSIETTTTSMAEVYFPAVTICNINQIQVFFCIARVSKVLLLCPWPLYFPRFTGFIHERNGGLREFPPPKRHLQ